MKPSLLDEDQLGGEAIKSQIQNSKTAAETLAALAPLPKDFVIVFTFKSVADSLRCTQDFTYVINTYTKEARLFHTDINSVYVVAIDFKSEIGPGDMEKLYRIIKNYFSNHVGNGDIHIQTYYRTNIFLNTNRTIDAERCVFDIHVNKNTPLDEDFIFTLTNRYSIQSNSFVLKISGKEIKLLVNK